jgi:hypothetical protein
MSFLYENEEVRFGNEFPSLLSFFKGDPVKTLVIFFPGGFHLGRISYGHPGCNEMDFLAYWLVKKGYSFLATSYPIDHPVYSDVYPEFALSDWGEMAAGIVNQFISENGLRRDVICINWSASGQVVRPFNVACKSLGINILFDLVIEASPPFLIPSVYNSGMKKNKNNMVNLKDKIRSGFWKLLEEQNKINEKEIISEKEYVDYYIGHMPVALMGVNKFLKNGEFVVDIERSFEDNNFFAFDEYPLIINITGDSNLAPEHPIVDKTTWAFLMTRKIYHDYFVQSQKSGTKMTGQDFKDFVRYVDKLPDRLSKVVSGNHFLFVGKKGARSVANHLEKFDLEVEKIKADISGILS